MKNNPGCWKDDKQRIPTEERLRLLFFIIEDDKKHTQKVL